MHQKKVLKQGPCQTSEMLVAFRSYAQWEIKKNGNQAPQSLYRSPVRTINCQHFPKLVIISYSPRLIQPSDGVVAFTPPSIFNRYKLHQRTEMLFYRARTSY